MDIDRPVAADAAEKEVEESREQLDRHLDELSEKLSPSNLAASAFAKVNPTEQIKKAVKSPSVVAAGLVAIGSIFALRRWRKRGRQNAS